MAGQRYSKQREMIYQWVCESVEHPTADMVYHQLKRTNPELSLGTVYRNLNLLSQEGKIRRMAFPVERYDGKLEPHAHMKCQDCGSVYDLEMQYDMELLYCMSQNSGHQIEGYDITFYGTCCQCKARVDH